MQRSAYRPDPAPRSTPRVSDDEISSIGPWCDAPAATSTRRGLLSEQPRHRQAGWTPGVSRRFCALPGRTLGPLDCMFVLSRPAALGKARGSQTATSVSGGAFARPDRGIPCRRFDRLGRRRGADLRESRWLDRSAPTSADVPLGCPGSAAQPVRPFGRMASGTSAGSSWSQPRGCSPGKQ